MGSGKEVWGFEGDARLDNYDVPIPVKDKRRCVSR